MRDKSKLTPRQERFVSEYMIDLNASAAARRAGYSENGASVTGSQLLANPKIAAAIKAAQYAIANRNAVTAQRVIEELAAVGFSDLGKARQLLDCGRLADLPDDAVWLVRGGKLNPLLGGEA